MSHLLGSAIQTDVCPYCWCLFVVEEAEKCRKCGAHICPLCDRCECKSQPIGFLENQWSNRTRKHRGELPSFTGQKHLKMKREDRRFH